MTVLERRLGELERRILPPSTQSKTREELLAQSMADLIAAFGEADVAAAMALDDEDDAAS